MSKTCFLCSSEIRGRAVKIWANPVGSQRAAWHDAHEDCAAMLRDDDGEDGTDDHECEYGMPVIAEDGSYTWTCPVCGDTQTCSKDLHDRIMADGMRIFRAVREKQQEETA